ncbi:HPr kinase/phosphorylase [Rhodovibrio salinarum]|uniref:HPr kinase/phosphorylase C-terminal domain-containing protein n=1 Tax=Rhodovibrio salinarum TaxID=1087 RepID=A0A934QFV2_9PROT|nr:hypothetical protein [Rhodovibrio salinarum]MBK1695867.1 hypothetical protein [Rhodovibrio salinarum]
MEETFVHASCAVLDHQAVLLRGPSGAGKSDLLLRLIVEAGAGLLADDQVRLRGDGAAVMASAPEAILGAMEVRGLGLVRLPPAPPTPVVLLVDLTDRPQRLPEPPREILLGCTLTRMELDARSPSAVAKLQLALGSRGATILPPDWHPEAPDGTAPGRNG